MALIRYLLESGSQGAAQTPANTGATLVSPGTGGAATFQSSQAAHGALGGQWVNAANTQCLTRWLTAAGAAGSPMVAFSGVFRLPAASPGAILVPCAQRHTAGGGVLTLCVGANRDIFVRDASAAQIGSLLAPAASTQWSQLVRYSYELQGQSTTAGVVAARLHDFITGALLGTVSTQAANLTDNMLTGADIGIQSVGPAAGTVVGADDIQFNDGTGPLAAIDNYTPAASALNWTHSVVPTSGVGPLTVQATINATGGTGGTLSYTFSWGDGAVTTLTSTAGTSTASHTYPASSDGLAHSYQFSSSVVNV